ncbi:MAG: phage tail tape measure protein [Bacteroidales bacterium]
MSEIISTRVALSLETEGSRKELKELTTKINESKDAIINLRKENINYSKELLSVSDKLEIVKESIKKLEEEEKTHTKSYQKKIEFQKQLETQYKSIQTARDKNRTSITQHTEDIDKNNVKLAELKGTLKNTELTFRELTQKKRQLEEAFKNTDPKTEKYKLLEGQLHEVTKEFNKQSFAIKDTRCKLSEYADQAHKYFYGIQMVYQTATNVLNKLVNLTQEYLTLSDKFSDVQKTTGLSTEAVRELDSELQKIDTRTSRQALLDLATDAGKLGISGKEDVLQFVKAADQIKVALGEDLGEGAIRDIGKMADVFGLTKKLGIEQSYLKIGSAINDLGQSSSASESYLVDFTQRLSGVAAQSGISIGNILGYASALDQSGQAVEVSATTMQNFIMKLFQEPSKFAKLAGKDVKDFTELLKTDANQAIKDILTSLNTQGGFSALVPIFDQLGLDGARSVGVFFYPANSNFFFFEKKSCNFTFYNFIHP